MNHESKFDVKDGVATLKRSELWAFACRVGIEISYTGAADPLIQLLYHEGGVPFGVFVSALPDTEAAILSGLEMLCLSSMNRDTTPRVKIADLIERNSGGGEA